MYSYEYVVMVDCQCVSLFVYIQLLLLAEMNSEKTTQLSEQGRWFTLFCK